MSRTIQQVHISDTKDLYLVEFNSDTNMLSYRISQNPKELIVSQAKIDGQTVKVDTYFFNIIYLLNINQQ